MPPPHRIHPTPWSVWAPCGLRVADGGIQGLLLRQYYRLAGEVEARNVQARQAMSPAERRKTSPRASQDVADTEVLVTGRSRYAALEDAGHLKSPVPSSLDPETRAVTNHTPPGRQLQDVATDYQHLLEDGGFDFGWFDGGCGVFAEGLHQWSGGAIELGAMSFAPGLASHAVGVLTVEVDGSPAQLLLDADGVSTEAGMARKLEALDNRKLERLIAVGAAAEDLLDELPYDRQVAKRLGSILAMHLGPYQVWRESLEQSLQSAPERQREGSNPSLMQPPSAMGLPSL